MDTLLILLGALLICAGLFWLVARAFATSLLWGCASLLPPLSLLFVVCRWSRARSAVGLIGLGCIPLVAGLTQLANQNPERLAALLSLSWLEMESEVVDTPGRQLHGEFNGMPFTPDQVEWRDGVLVLREERAPRRELRIRLPGRGGMPLQADVLPEDRGDLPVIDLAWQSSHSEGFELRRIVNGYSLHLAFQPAAGHLSRGDFHLVLPPAFRTSLSGSLELNSSRLDVAAPPSVQAPPVRLAEPIDDRRIGFSLARLLERPTRYLGMRVQVLTERGRSAEGYFAGLSETGRLIIRHSLGGQGEASFILRPSEVVQIQLLEP